MLEAVNSVVSNAAIISASNKQVSEAPVKAAETIKTIEVDPYLSRGLKYDEQLQRPVLQIRDTNTGGTLKQFPTETQIKAYTSRQSAVSADIGASSGASEASASADINIDIGRSTPDVEVNVAPAQAPTQNASAATLAVSIDTQV